MKPLLLNISILSALNLVLLACGSSSPEPVVATAPKAEIKDTHIETDAKQVAVEGITGTMEREDIELAMQSRMMKFSHCLSKGMNDVEQLAGEMTLHFWVNSDGSTRDVQATNSTFGHRGTERCLVAAAKTAHFSVPQGGGAAEFSWAFASDLDPEFPAPHMWDASFASTLVSEKQHALSSACPYAAGGSLAIDVTAYIQEGAHVLASGASSELHLGDDALDCVAQEVRAWTFPEPGPSGAKIQFPVTLNPVLVDEGLL